MTKGIYFSAHWCPPCRGFTPELAKFYNTCADEKFMIVFISSDRDEASFKEYYNEMPWSALKFEDRDAKAKLSEMFGVQGIPTFIILNGNGDVVEKGGRGVVMNKIGNGDFSAKSW
ncbi:NXN-like protein [Mya arenaria]|uniref:protein-disulfide reductase n=1 Tax=Mya arenaria TaxID=6604 RepID=A0ABY7DG69_MYAAR|nr:NXN-like protein [Mya arenaria]